MGLRDRFNSKMFEHPLFIFWICGLAGVVVDIDHPLFHSRAFHTPVLIISMCVIVSCIGRLLYRLVLDKSNKENKQ